MRPMLIVIAATCFIAAPAAAQDREADTIRGAAGAIQQAAPALDRATDAMLDLDVGPILDAARPYGPRVRHHRTLRQMARRDDPYFERHMRDSIYGASARASRTLEALAASEPGLRRSLFEMEANLRAAIRGVPPYGARPYAADPRRAPPYVAPPRDDDEDWGGPDDEPYRE